MPAEYNLNFELTFTLLSTSLGFFKDDVFKEYIICMRPASLEGIFEYTRIFVHHRHCTRHNAATTCLVRPVGRCLGRYGTQKVPQPLQDPGRVPEKPGYLYLDRQTNVKVGVLGGRREVRRVPGTY